MSATVPPCSSPAPAPAHAGPNNLDLLGLPLHGLQWIEASAGTGKTYTLAALVVRAVLGHPGPLAQGLMPPQILVMTYTEAATSELRARIRLRLAQAALALDADAPADLPAGDAFLQALWAAYPLAALRAQAARQLRLAEQWMDQAAVHTLHGWCQRVLRRHALACDAALERTLLDDPAGLQAEVARDFWRRVYLPLPAVHWRKLASLWASPEDLLMSVKAVWQAWARDPAKQPQPQPSGAAALLSVWADWWRVHADLQAGARSAWTPAQLASVQAAVQERWIGGRQDHWQGRIDKLTQWLQAERNDCDWMVYFDPQNKDLKKWSAAAAHPGLLTLTRLHAHAQIEPPVQETLLQEAAAHMAVGYAAAKAAAGVFDFDDLIEATHRALHADDGALARSLAQEYPLALVDEFQDTDRWQWGSLARIYQDPASGARGAVLVGDPKQAIYSFRGADLDTYLAARRVAQGRHALSANHRSSAQLVEDVNRLFELAERPFGAIDFVRACSAAPLPPLQVDGQPRGLTVWPVDDAQNLNTDAWRAACAAVAAQGVVQALAQGWAQAGDCAVLVREGAEARAMQVALAAHALPSVYLSEKDSVWASTQAADARLVLHALAQPHDAAAARAALSCASWGWDLAELCAVLEDDARWDAQLATLMDARSVWLQHGVLAALHHLIHAGGWLARWVQQPARQSERIERVLTNWLHLAELLQAASARHTSPAALLRWLDDQLQDPQQGGAAALLRLESDARCVQIVTLHKSKGLQYPLVWLPFAGRALKEGDDPQEAMRLLYVGLTRAQRGLWLLAAASADEFKNAGVRASALARLMGRKSDDDAPAALARWASLGVCVQAAPRPDATPPSPEAEPASVPDAAGATGVRGSVAQGDDPGGIGPGLRVAHRRLGAGPWRASFSALLHAAAPLDATRADADDAHWPRWVDAALDQPDLAPDPAPPPADAEGGDAAPAAAGPSRWQALSAGPALGSLLHEALQHQSEAHWPARHGAEPGRAWVQQLLTRALAIGLDDGPALAQWVVDIAQQKWLTTPVRRAQNAPEPVAIYSPPQWAEMAFVLPLRAACDSAQIDAALQSHIAPGLPRAALAAHTLHGWLVGSMDLVLQLHGRWWVLDYKTNRLPDYTPATLQADALAHRYDAQAALYTLALHRLLQARWPAYQPERDLGGPIYAYLRGLDAPGAGLWCPDMPLALIDTLEGWLASAQSPLAQALT